MGQPTPPGDIPLYADLGVEWNDVLSGFPEDKRAEFAPKIHEKLNEKLKTFEPLRQYEDFHKSGVGPDHIGTALQVMSTIENNPHQVYEMLGKYLNITPKQAEEVVKDVKNNQESDESDPRYEALQNQVNTLAQIALAKRNEEEQSALAAQQDRALEEELSNLKKQHGDFPEDEIIMRMLHKDLTAKQAFDEYAQFVEGIQRRRPAPFVLGSGGAVPREPLDVKKLTGPQTKDVVAQMLQHANQERQSS